jgi:acyl-CoA thioester hydrolase
LIQAPPLLPRGGGKMSGVASFVCKCPLRWSDVDSYGHVNNVQQLKLLEEARVALFFEAATQAGISTFDGDLVVVRHEIDYKRPLLYRSEPLTVELGVTELKASSVTIAYVIRDDEWVYSQAASVLAAYDTQAERPRRLSREERDWLRHYTAETPPQ